MHGRCGIIETPFRILFASILGLLIVMHVLLQEMTYRTCKPSKRKMPIKHTLLLVNALLLLTMGSQVSAFANNEHNDDKALLPAVQELGRGRDFRQSLTTPPAINAHQLSNKELTESYRTASARFQARDYDGAISSARRYQALGGTAPEMQRLLGRAYFMNGDIPNATRELQKEIQNTEKAGHTPTEDSLRLLGTCYQRLNDNNAYAWSLERLVIYHPRKEYWAELLEQTQKRPDFGARLALDVQRLRFLTGGLHTPADYVRTISLSLQHGFPLEAKVILDKGIANGVLSSTGQGEAQVHLWGKVRTTAEEEKKRLAKLEADAKIDTNKNPLTVIDLGFSFVTNGEFQKGLSLMEVGIGKNNQSRTPQDAKLRLGIAYLMAGQKNKALETFKGVGGVHGAADLARLWSIYAQSRPD